MEVRVFSTAPALLAIALLASGVAQGAVAQPAASAEPPAGHADTVVVKAHRPVVVTASTCPEPDPAHHPATQAPRVVDSYPAPGALIAPGESLVRITFDAPMSCYSEVMVDGPGDPCRPTGAWDLPARRSWTMRCRFAPATAYVVTFRRIDGLGFVGLSGRAAEPFELAFATSDAAPVPTEAAADALDPGPPGRAASYGVVACTDRGARAGVRDCLRTVTPAPR